MQTTSNKHDAGKHTLGASIRSVCPGTNATWTNSVKEVTPVIHPDVSQASIVVVNNATCATGECVWCCLAENMADMRACDNQ